MGLLDNVELVNLNWDLYQNGDHKWIKLILLIDIKLIFKNLLSKSSTLLKNNGILI